MTGVPRSQVFIRHQFAAVGPSPVFTIPDGYVALVKSVYVTNNNTAVAHISVLVLDPSPNIQVVIWDADIQASGNFSGQGWIVGHPGMLIYVYSDQVNVTAWVSGALLAGPPQFPPSSRELPVQQPHG